jgi:hypothetical protein
VTITLAVAVVLAVAAIQFGPEIAHKIGGWWDDFVKLWEQKRADFITWWNTSSPDWMPKLGGPVPGANWSNQNTGPTTFSGPSPDSRDRAASTGSGSSASSSPLATLDDIYAAYNRITGNQIDLNYARSILGKGLNYQQVANANPFLAQGGIALRPVTAHIGEAGPEAVVPLSRSKELGFGGGGDLHIKQITINGDVDSKESAQEMGREIIRQARLQGLTA